MGSRMREGGKGGEGRGEGEGGREGGRDRESCISCFRVCTFT